MSTRTKDKKILTMLILQRYIFYLADKISLVIIPTVFKYEISSVVILIIYRDIQKLKSLTNRNDNDTQILPKYKINVFSKG